MFVYSYIHQQHLNTTLAKRQTSDRNRYLHRSLCNLYPGHIVGDLLRKEENAMQDLLEIGILFICTFAAMTVLLVFLSAVLVVWRFVIKTEEVPRNITLKARDDRSQD